MNATRVRVYIDTPLWYVRPKNTDWVYTRSLRALSKYTALEIQLSRNLRVALAENWYWLRAKLTNLGIWRTRSTRYFRSVRITPKADLVYSHGRFPTTRLPVVWFYGVVDPLMRVARGESHAAIEREYVELERPFTKAALVLLPSRAMVVRHRARYPQMADKFQYCPFFVEGIQVATVDAVLAKHQSPPVVRLLFVGREGLRKGLDVLIEALEGLPIELQRKIRLDVVTRDEELIPAASCYQLGAHRELPKEAVLQLMRSAHVFAMPSRFESYGLVYLEAMASGATVLGPDWECQREIVDGGAAGVVTPPTAPAVREVLRQLIEDDNYRATLAVAALHRYAMEYGPEVTAKTHSELFVRAVRRKPQSGRR